MYDVHIEVESLVYIYVYVGSRTIFFPVSATHNTKTCLFCDGCVPFLNG